MPGSLVDRATTDQLIGPDWAMNLEICETLNREPGLAKDVVKGLRKRIGHKNPKVQLLALTGLRQEVIIDLVHQCRLYKQRLVHLANSTSDEDLLCQGLALNDDLQRVLSKYDAFAAGVAVRVEKTKSLQALVDIDDPVVTNSDGSNQLPLQQLLIPGPPPSNGTATISASAGSHIDLLSDDYDTSADKNLLALVPVSEPLTDSATEQNALVLSDIFSQSTNNNGNNTLTTPFDSLSKAPAAQAYPSSPQSTLYSNGSIPNSGIPQFQQIAYHGAPLNNGNTGNCQAVQGMTLQQPPLGVNDQGLPLPPWETQTVESSQVGSPQTQIMQNGLPGVMHPQMMQNSQLGATHPEMMQSNQQLGMHPLQIQNSPQSQMQNSQLPGTFSQPMQGCLQPGVYPSGPYSQPMQGGHPAGYPGYVQQQPQAHVYDQSPSYPSYPNPNEISQGMYGLSVQENCGYANASSSYPSYVPKFSKPEDKLFGDLVSMAKTKQNKTSASDAGNL